MESLHLSYMNPEFTKSKCTGVEEFLNRLKGGQGGGTLHDQKLSLSVSYEIFFMRSQLLFSNEIKKMLIHKLIFNVNAVSCSYRSMPTVKFIDVLSAPPITYNKTYTQCQCSIPLPPQFQRGLIDCYGLLHHIFFCPCTADRFPAFTCMIICCVITNYQLSTFGIHSSYLLCVHIWYLVMGTCKGLAVIIDEHIPQLG